MDESGLCALLHSFTPSLTHAFTPSLVHLLTPSPLQSLTPSLLHSHSPSRPPSFTPLILHSLTPSPPDSFTPSISHSFTPSFLHSFTPSTPSLLVQAWKSLFQKQGSMCPNWMPHPLLVISFMHLDCLWAVLPTRWSAYTSMSRGYGPDISV
jgi:hypothetical protein